MERFAAFVDGHAEESFFRRASSAHVQRSIRNGDDYPLDKIVRDVRVALGTLSGKVQKIVVLVDRESRAETAEDIAKYILAGISNDLGGRQCAVGVKDRHLENWILADAALMQDRCKDGGYQYCHEGSKGKPILKSMLGRIDLGPTETADLLKACTASRLKAASTSFARMHNALDLDWYWWNR